MKDLHPIISENLTTLRKSSGLTQAQLAERLGYSDKAVSRWEKGDTLPDINVLYELCDYYGITIDSLLEKGGADSKQIKKRSSVGYSIIVMLLSVAIVWLIATVLFVYLNAKSHINFWQAFVWAVPLSDLVVAISGRRFRSDAFRFVTSTVFVWTLLASLYLQFLQYNIWLIFIIGIPVQAICILWFAYKKYK